MRCLACVKIMTGTEMKRKDKGGKYEKVCTVCLVAAGIYTQDTLLVHDFYPQIDCEVDEDGQ